MRSKLIRGIIAATIFIGLSLLLTILISGDRLRAAAQDPGDHAVHDDHSGDDHQEHADESIECGQLDCPTDHDHEGHAQQEEDTDHDPDYAVSGQHEESDDHAHDHRLPPVDEKALFDMSCEHDIPIVQCNDCRYEVGVVAIDPALSKGLLETQVAQPGTMERVLRLTGEVQLDLARVAEVAPAGTGRAEQLYRILGDRVSASAPLAVIESSEFGQAQAEFLAEKARLELAQATFERENRLYEQKISSEADFIAAVNALKASKATMIAAEKRLQLFGLSEEQVAEFGRQQTNGSFGQFVLTAPIDGIIIKQNIVRGRLVKPADTLYTIADFSSVWVWCDVYERDLMALYEQVAGNENVPVTIRVSAFPDEVFKGAVDMIGNEVDHDTRTIRVRVTAENRQTRLKPGMFADVQIMLSHKQSVIRIPETAVLSDSAEKFVFEHLGGDLWIRRDIITGQTGGGLVAVLSGLKPGATIAARGAFMFKSEVLKEKMGAGCAH